MSEHWRHSIRMKAPATGLPVGNADIVFEVSDEDEGGLIGTLYVSRGRVEWRSANHKYPWSKTWRQFDEMTQSG